MLGSAVSSSTPKDFQPNSHMGQMGCRPLISRHAWPAPPGRAYAAVGMQSALDSVIDLPSRSTSASRVLVLVMPAEVRRSLMPPEEISYLTGVQKYRRAALYRLPTSQLPYLSEIEAIRKSLSGISFPEIILRSFRRMTCCDSQHFLTPVQHVSTLHMSFLA